MPNSIDARLVAAQVAIDNALSNPDVQSYLSVYGYDADKIGAGKALYDNAQQLHQQQVKEYGDQFAASDALKSTWEQAKAEYMRFVKIARVALKSERAAFQKLALNGDRKQSLSGWLSQAKQFYINALADADILTKLGQFGITQEKLQAGTKLVEDTEAANVAQEKEKGEAQQATLERDQALDQLDEWMSDFTAIARIALEEKPQLLENLGIVEPS
ncbi:hypothetical protein GWO43_08945 [candidate division KSB1 bacterium]|nr:hypothetical protein [candidate division KSB1 bacterium]NIV69017.1 hypothetical protein [Phycisphaerae bacterium]NIR69016.1 hypothetical protein [candidate division KSB1 bacterium]NIS24088.1 hypothetical protein [candidate division KSB1 bacterium]NIT71007.1 hypothetical protein [candidate division KSB1 bacterium]